MECCIHLSLLQLQGQTLYKVIACSGHCYRLYCKLYCCIIVCYNVCCWVNIWFKTWYKTMTSTSRVVKTWICALCDVRQPWILWWRRTWKLTWPAGTFRNTSKRIHSLSTLNTSINDPTWELKRDCQREMLSDGNLPSIVECNVEWIQMISHQTVWAERRVII